MDLNSYILRPLELAFAQKLYLKYIGQPLKEFLQWLLKQISDKYIYTEITISGDNASCAQMFITTGSPGAPYDQSIHLTLLF